MDPDHAWAALRRALAPHEGRVKWGLDDVGGALVFLTLDLTHLDADALNDRLHAWIRHEVDRIVPHASAFVSFRHARPATMDEAEWGTQAEWVGLEPTLRLELARPPPTEAEVDAFVRLVPEFLRRVHAEGRPEGWRDVNVGNAE